MVRWDQWAQSIKEWLLQKASIWWGRASLFLMLGATPQLFVLLKHVLAFVERGSKSLAQYRWFQLLSILPINICYWIVHHSVSYILKLRELSLIEMWCMRFLLKVHLCILNINYWFLGHWLPSWNQHPHSVSLTGRFSNITAGLGASGCLWGLLFLSSCIKWRKQSLLLLDFLQCNPVVRHSLVQ